jgi:hypothetical protein
MIAGLSTTARICSAFWNGIARVQDVLIRCRPSPSQMTRWASGSRPNSSRVPQEAQVVVAQELGVIPVNDQKGL